MPNGFHRKQGGARLVCLCLCLLLWLDAGRASAAAAAVDMARDGAPCTGQSTSLELVRLMRERLELMPQVAAYKFVAGQPVEDAAREAVVLAAVRERALRYGLVPETVEQLFRVQIEAAKIIQQYWLDAWHEGRSAVPSAPDLDAVVRPRLSQLGDEIVAAAGRAAGSEPAGHRCPLARPATVPATEFDLPGLDPETGAALVSAVEGLATYRDRLRQVLESGRLRIGVTGDYAPFGLWRDAAAEPEGIDIDLGRDLARALGVEVIFVRTSWPRLKDDLTAGAFDIAMNGVSGTLERQRVGFASLPYYADGKTPIGRCADRDRFGSLEAIDLPTVRVVVNPGGTNERFVEQRLRRAQKIIYPDNRTIFNRLLEGEADVMFTDRIEVSLQTRLHPELCAMMATDLTYQEKVYLLPQDAVWLAFVDAWLAERLLDGTVTEVFQAHGFKRHAPRGRR